MRKISLGLTEHQQLISDAMLVCIPGPPSERPYGVIGDVVILSPLAIKLPFDQKLRHELIVISWFRGNDSFPSRVEVLLDPTKEEKRLLWNTTSKPTFEAVKELLDHPKLQDLTPNRAFKLKPVHIPKPWGQEIWFTGIEERGIAQIQVKDQESIILPILLATLGKGATSNPASPPILLKILDPKPNPKTGSLYFELHQEKQEVYIVSKIHPEAWPAGIGRMKYGLNQKERHKFQNQDEFKETFKKLCLEYESCRMEIEGEWDKKRLLVGLGPKDQIPEPLLESWYSSLPPALAERETNLQKQIDQLTGWLNLSVGDVVKVQKTVPHSLQFGITVIEFQTPVYERFIITFNQKVLTQDHWDVEAAFNIMTVEEPAPQNLKQITENDAALLEEAVSFETFDVIRVTQKKTKYALDLSDCGHAIIFALKGRLQVHGISPLTLEMGEACFIPAALNHLSIVAENQETVWLLGREKRQS